MPATDFRDDLRRVRADYFANPSLEPTRTGMALGPPPGVVHHPSGGPSAIPALAPQLKRYSHEVPQLRLSNP